MNMEHPEAIRQPEKQPSVLIVCTANRCRSPMAEALLLDYVARVDVVREWRISSAGTWAIENLPAMPLAIAVMEERRIDLRAHRSSQVDADLLQRNNLILVMKKGHKESICLEFPHIAERVYLISEMADYAYEIEDPVAGTIVDYRNTAEQLYALIQEGHRRIHELAARDARSS